MEDDYIENWVTLESKNIVTSQAKFLYTQHKNIKTTSGENQYTQWKYIQTFATVNLQQYKARGSQANGTCKKIHIKNISFERKYLFRKLDSVMVNLWKVVKAVNIVKQSHKLQHTMIPISKTKTSKECQIPCVRCRKK